MNTSFSRQTIATVAGLLLAMTLPSVAGQLVKQDVEGIRNFTRVDATVACAGATAVEAIPELKRQGFRAIVNLRLATEDGANVEESQTAAESAGLRYLHIPFETVNPDFAVADAFLAAVTDPENQPVFIHCGSANRVGALWLTKRVLKDGWAIEEAVKEAEAIGLRSDTLREFALKYIEARREHLER